MPAAKTGYEARRKAVYRVPTRAECVSGSLPATDDQHGALAKPVSANLQTADI